MALCKSLQQQQKQTEHNFFSTKVLLCLVLEKGKLAKKISFVQFFLVVDFWGNLCIQ